MESFVEKWSCHLSVLASIEYQMAKSTNGDEEYAIRRHINVQNAPTVTLHHWHHRMSIVIWKVRMKTAVTWSGFMPSCLTIIVHFYVRTLMTRAVSMATRMMFLLLWEYVETGRFHTQLNVPALVKVLMSGYSLKNHYLHSSAWLYFRRRQCDKSHG